MTHGETATVYCFHEPASGDEMPRRSPYKATRETIASLGGELLEGTAEEVPLEAILDGGRYQRVATGWGSLA